MSYTQTHRGSAPVMPAVSSSHTRVSSGPAIPGSAYYSNDSLLSRPASGSWSASTLAAAQRRRQMTPVAIRAPIRQGETCIEHPPLSGRSFSSPAVLSAATTTASPSVPNRYHRASRVAGLQPPQSVSQFGSASPSLDGESTSTVTSRSSASSYTSNERSPMLVGKDVASPNTQAIPFNLRGHKHKLSTVSIQTEHRAKRLTTVPQDRRTSAGSIASQTSERASLHTLVLPSDEMRSRRASMPQLTTVYSPPSVAPEKESAASSDTITPSVSATQLDSVYRKEMAVAKAPRQRPVSMLSAQANETTVTANEPSFSLSPVSQESAIQYLSGIKNRSGHGTSKSLSSTNPEARPESAVAVAAANKETVKEPSPKETLNAPPKSSALQMPIIPRAKQNMTPTVVASTSPASIAQNPPRRDHSYASAHESVPVYESLKEDAPSKKVSFKQKLKNMMSKKHKSRSKDSDAVSVRSGTSMMSGLSVFSGRSISSTFSFRSFRMFNKHQEEAEELPPVMHNFDIAQPPLVPVITTAVPGRPGLLPSPPTSIHCNNSDKSQSVRSPDDKEFAVAGRTEDSEHVLKPVASNSSEDMEDSLSVKPCVVTEAPSDFNYDDVNDEAEEGMDLSSGGTVFPGSLDEKDVATIRSALERVSSLDRKPSRRSSRGSRKAIPISPRDTSTDDFEQTLEQLDSFVNLSLASIPALPGSEPPRAVRFVNQIRVYETHSCAAYDRRPEPATCNRLTPLLAQQIKRELNALKLTMEVHHDSRDNTHFF